VAERDHPATGGPGCEITTSRAVTRRQQEAAWWFISTALNKCGKLSTPPADSACATIDLHSNSVWRNALMACCLSVLSTGRQAAAGPAHAQDSLDRGPGRGFGGPLPPQPPRIATFQTTLLGDTPAEQVRLTQRGWRQR
jgi:hypothetical protein